MKCILCESYAFSHICSTCQTNFLTPSIYKRKLPNGIDIISFYKYEEIKELLFTKHTDMGFYIYNILAKLSFKKFAEEFHTKEQYVSVAIDDVVKNGYSHTAILNKQLQSYNITPNYNILRAQNSVSYSGQSRKFRENNKRNFKVSNFKGDNVILIDDIVTTGLTMQEAITALNKKNVALCLSLVDLGMMKE